MGHSTGSGRNANQEFAKRVENSIRREYSDERLSSLPMVTNGSIKEAFASLRTQSGYVGDAAIGRVAEIVDMVRPGVRLEMRNERSKSDDAVYYEKNERGEWYVSRVARGRLTDRRALSSARQVVTSIMQGGVVDNPDRLRVINAR